MPNELYYRGRGRPRKNDVRNEVYTVRRPRGRPPGSVVPRVPHPMVQQAMLIIQEAREVITVAQRMALTATEKSREARRTINKMKIYSCLVCGGPSEAGCCQECTNLIEIGQLLNKLEQARKSMHSIQGART